MEDPDDQHAIVLAPGIVTGNSVPVLIAFHGQPKRGEAPRGYAFPKTVTKTVLRAVAEGRAPPLVLVLPVFRYAGTNWPSFDLLLFRDEVERRLADLGLRSAGYYLIGHSGAAGCGGDGMNRAHRIRPLAVGFFDTCLGRGWRDEIHRLREANTPTLMIHSLETAAFSPRQPIEYSTTFDFGRAYGPAGLSAASCPGVLPRAPLRHQPFRCSSDEEGVTRAFVIDTGEGETGHNAVVPVALDYFLEQYVGARSPTKARP